MFTLQHSATVHIPLALAVLFPPAHLLFLYLMRTQFFPRKSWLLLFGLGAVQMGASIFAYLTGRQHLALSPAPSELLLRHQELAWRFSWAWAAILILLPLAFGLRQKTVSKLAHVLLLILLAAQIVIALRLGHLGGELVFGS